MILPDYIELSDWAASLVIDFPYDNIPILTSEDKWREWGDLLLQEQSFLEQDAPPPGSFGDWRKWAKAVFYAMANNE